MRGTSISATAKFTRPAAVWRETTREKRWLRTIWLAEALRGAGMNTERSCEGITQPVAAVQAATLLLLLAAMAPENDVSAYRVPGTNIARRLPLMK